MENKLFKGIAVAMVILIAFLLGGYGIYTILQEKSDIPSQGKISGNSISSESVANSSNSNKGDQKQNPAMTPASSRTKEAIRAEFEEKLDAMIEKIDYFYYEDADYETLYDAMLHSAVYSLGDPYSTYYSPEEFDDLLESASGVYSGIGATISQNMTTKKMIIVTPFADSPANKSGILPGDEIIGVDGEDVIGQDLNSVVARIKGPEGTDVMITVLRDEQEITFTVTRAKIEVEYCSHKMLDNNIGYILMTEFEETTATQFSMAISELQSQGMQALIVDLRGNPGGLYNIVCDALDRILPKGSLLVYTVDKYNNKECEYAKKDATLDIPIVVLVDGNSASASEIFSGALQDYGAATIIGTQTFGKGIVQSIVPLTMDGSGIKLTSSRYYTPNGVCIHGTGITPDIVVELEEGLETKLIEQRDHDNQIDAAVEFLLKEISK